MRIAPTLALALLLACNGGRARQSPTPGPASGPTAPVPQSTTSTPAPPPGDDTLIPVPPAIAAHVQLVQIADGFERPVLLVAAPDDPRKRLFVVEQRGTIRWIEHGVVAKGTLIDLHGQLSTGNEQGLLGLAFHPKFAINHELYLNFTTQDGNTHIVEYTLDGDAIRLASAREIIEIDQPYPNHNGGNLRFGPDGKLYVGMGDGGSAGDPHRNAQNPAARLGKILRFDVDAPGTPTPEVVVLGTRNPWRWWFDEPTGDLYVGDVGQDLWENVYVVPGDDHRVHDFGWNVVEGNHCYKADRCDRAGFTPPAADYPHTQGCSVTGGVTYRGAALPALAGRYFYADYCTGLLRSFRWTERHEAATAPLGEPTGWVRDHWDWKAAIDRDGVLAQISSFGVDAAGEVYIVLLTGAIYELAPRA